ncbi:MAG: hypothetical protein DBY41_08865 [Clostridium sp.]|nr:MAG: hypothetical protein DBY41_08865 [Clostridium sp.]
MTEELKNIIAEWRSKGVHIADEEAEYILWYCKRKMEVAKVSNPEEYLPLLYEDEVKNYLYRQSVNATTILRKLKEEGVCAACV